MHIVRNIYKDSEATAKLIKFDFFTDVTFICVKCNCNLQWHFSFSRNGFKRLILDISYIMYIRRRTIILAGWFK